MLKYFKWNLHDGGLPNPTGPLPVFHHRPSYMQKPKPMFSPIKNLRDMHIHNSLSNAVDETNNYWLWEKIIWFHILLESFLYWYQSTAMSNQQTMIQSWSSYPDLWKFEGTVYAYWCFGNRCLMAWFNLTLTATISFTNNCNRHRHYMDGSQANSHKQQNKHMEILHYLFCWEGHTVWPW